MDAAGADSPWLTALVLLEHATELGREQVLAHPERTLTRTQAAAFGALVERRCRREPLAYVLGYREFYGRRIAVNPLVLIPRPETEGLVALALERMLRWTRRQDDHEQEGARTAAAPPMFVDVGTGSGAIAVTLLAQEPRWVAAATDTQLSALATARANAAAWDVDPRLRLVACNLADAVRVRVPLVVANLPYVPSAEIAQLEPEVSHYEPRAALDGGEDGTVITSALVAALPTLLLPHGAAILELGEGQAEKLRTLARQALPDSSVAVERDAAGIERFLVVERGA